MTSCGPYSEATLIYEPQSVFILGAVPTPGTIFEFVGRNFPSIFKTIQLARFSKFFNDSDDISLFIFSGIECPSDIQHAVELCRSLSINKRIGPESLKCSPCLILKTNHCSSNLIVKSDGVNVTINGQALIDCVECSNGIVHILS